MGMFICPRRLHQSIFLFCLILLPNIKSKDNFNVQYALHTVQYLFILIDRFLWQFYWAFSKALCVPLLDLDSFKLVISVIMDFLPAYVCQDHVKLVPDIIYPETMSYPWIMILTSFIEDTFLILLSFLWDSL